METRVFSGEAAPCSQSLIVLERNKARLPLSLSNSHMYQARSIPAQHENLARDTSVPTLNAKSGVHGRTSVVSREFESHVHYEKRFLGKIRVKFFMSRSDRTLFLDAQKLPRTPD